MPPPCDAVRTTIPRRWESSPASDCARTHDRSQYVWCAMVCGHALMLPASHIRQHMLISNGSLATPNSLPLALQQTRTRPSKCAVVGSSGILRDAHCGREIDGAHDVIIRINSPVVRGFEADVGSRTSVQLLNSAVATAYHHNLSHIRERGTSPKRRIEFGLDGHASAIAVGPPALHIRTPNLVWFAPSNWHAAFAQRLQVQGKRVPMTKGFDAILMAMSLCDGDVDTYGFTGADSGGGGGAAEGFNLAGQATAAPRYHYWEPPSSANSDVVELEAMRLEHALVSAMANLTGACARVRGVTCPEEATASGGGMHATETSPRRTPCRSARMPVQTRPQ